MSKHISWILIFAIIGGLSNSATSQNTSPIIMITNNWTSQIVLTHIVGSLFEQQGYTVKFIDSPVSDQWGALSYGVGHIQVEVWEGTMADQFNRLVALGRLEDMGDHQAKTREEWWYPSYIEPLCPGLPSWKALAKCTQLFSRDTSQTGVYIAGPWEKPDEARIRALGMNFKVIVVNKGDDLWLELEKAVKHQQPIVLFNWSPNWVESRYSGKFVEFPPYDPKCESEPSWGINKKFLYDCGNPTGGWLKKAAWPKLKTHWPCAYDALKNISFSNAQISEVAAYVDVDKLTHKQAAQKWLANNASVWQSWLQGVCQNG